MLGQDLMQCGALRLRTGCSEALGSHHQGAHGASPRLEPVPVFLWPQAPSSKDKSQPSQHSFLLASASLQGCLHLTSSADSRKKAEYEPILRETRNRVGCSESCQGFCDGI